MLYLESPVGVGFSYSDDQKYITNDTEVSERLVSYWLILIRCFKCLLLSLGINEQLPGPERVLSTVPRVLQEPTFPDWRELWRNLYPNTRRESDGGLQPQPAGTPLYCSDSAVNH